MTRGASACTRATRGLAWCKVLHLGPPYQPSGEFLFDGVAESSLDFGGGSLAVSGKGDMFLVQLSGMTAATSGPRATAARKTTTVSVACPSTARATCCFPLPRAVRSTSAAAPRLRAERCS
jgi:hypothetical protein